MKKNCHIFNSLAVITLFLTATLSACSSNQDGDVPIAAHYPNKKIVYGPSDTIDKALVQNHCAQQKGEFNECGNICPPEAESCAQVCAFTCKLEADTQNSNDKTISYENDKIGFSLEYTADFKLDSHPSPFGKVITFTKWGPSQKKETEFYDGISISVYQRDVDGPSLKALAESDLEQTKDLGGEIEYELRNIVINNVEGYEYKQYTIGTPTRTIFLPYGPQKALVISASVGDPTNQGFEEEAQQIINSIELVDVPELNIQVTNPQPGDSVNSPLEVEGIALVFENNVDYRLKDSSSNILAEGSVTANALDIGLFGDFTISIPYSTSDSSGTLEVFSTSAADGSEINKVIIPLSF